MTLHRVDDNGYTVADLSDEQRRDVAELRLMGMTARQLDELIRSSGPHYDFADLLRHLQRSPPAILELFTRD